jgi:hypothetical protein
MNNRTKPGRVISLLEEEKEKENETKDQRFSSIRFAIGKNDLKVVQMRVSERQCGRSRDNTNRNATSLERELCDLKATRQALEDTSHGFQSKIVVQEVTIVNQQAGITLLKNYHLEKAIEELHENRRQDIRDVE